MQAPVPDEAIGITQPGMTQKSECAEAVVDRHHDDVATRRQLGAAVEEDRAAARREPPAVNPHHDGSSLDRGGIVGDFRRPDVQGEAILALHGVGARIGGTGQPRLGDPLRCDRSE